MRLLQRGCAGGLWVTSSGTDLTWRFGMFIFANILTFKCGLEISQNGCSLKGCDMFNNIRNRCWEVFAKNKRPCVLSRSCAMNQHKVVNYCEVKGCTWFLKQLHFMPTTVASFQKYCIWQPHFHSYSLLISAHPSLQNSSRSVIFNKERLSIFKFCFRLQIRFWSKPF